MAELLLRLEAGSELVPVWRDGIVLDARVRSRALPIVVLELRVRVTPESPAVPAGWETLEQAVATLSAVYGDPLELEYLGPAAEFNALYARAAAEPGLPEPV